MGPFFVLLQACVNPTLSEQEYNLAQVALKSAQDSEARRYAPKVFSQARRYMKKAERSYKKRDFDLAEKYFKKSRYYSEKAENISRVKMFTKGDMLP